MNNNIILVVVIFVMLGFIGGTYYYVSTKSTPTSPPIIATTPPTSPPTPPTPPTPPIAPSSNVVPVPAVQNPLCNTSVCKTGFILKKPVPSDRCISATCTETECCDPECLQENPGNDTDFGTECIKDTSDNKWYKSKKTYNYINGCYKPTYEKQVCPPINCTYIMKDNAPKAFYIEDIDGDYIFPDTSGKNLLGIEYTRTQDKPPLYGGTECDISKKIDRSMFTNDGNSALMISINFDNNMTPPYKVSKSLSDKYTIKLLEASGEKSLLRSVFGSSWDALEIGNHLILNKAENGKDKAINVQFESIPDTSLNIYKIKISNNITSPEYYIGFNTTEYRLVITSKENASNFRLIPTIDKDIYNLQINYHNKWINLKKLNWSPSSSGLSEDQIQQKYIENIGFGIDYGGIYNYKHRFEIIKKV